MKYLENPETMSSLRKSKDRTGVSRTSVFLWFPLSVVSVIGSSGLLNSFSYFGWVTPAIINVLAIYHSRQFPPLTIILLFKILFLIYAIPHFFFDISIVNIPVQDGLPYLTQALWNAALFISVFMIWTTNVLRSDWQASPFMQIIFKLRLPKSPIIFNLLIITNLVAIFFGIRGSIVLGVEGGYDSYVENLQSASGLQEYLLVLFIITGALIKTRLQKVLWYIVLAIFVVKLSLVGLRIVALMGLLLGLWFSGINFKLRQTLTLFAFGFLLMSLLGLLKAGSFDMSDILFELHGDNLVSHHSNVLWASTAMLQLIDGGVIEISRRLDLLSYFLLNTIIPSGILQGLFGQPYLGTWLQENGYTSGGGHAATYAYLAGGSLGIVLVASLWGFAFKISLSNNTTAIVQFFRCWFLMTLITFPRWISYDIGNFFFRLPIYASLLAVLIIIISQSTPRASLKYAYINR